MNAVTTNGPREIAGDEAPLWEGPPPPMRVVSAHARWQAISRNGILTGPASETWYVETLSNNSMPPRFIYFDLGKVLVDFDVARMYRQMAEVAGIEPSQVREAVSGGGLQRQYELGQISGRQFYEAFCRMTGTRPDHHALRLAGSDIFELNATILPVVAQLQQAGHRLGILSNTCSSHWEHCRSRYRIIAEAFEPCVLSCHVGAAKPEARIYLAAAESAGVAPEEVFFVDDLWDNVAGARAVGFDAVAYESASHLAAELRRRAVRFNY